MERENKLLLFLGGLIVLGLIGALVWVNVKDRIPSTAKNNSEETPALNMKALIEVPTLTDEKKNASDPAAHYSVDVHYPSVSLVDHPELAKEASAVIKSFADDAISAFKKDVTEMYSPDVPKEFESDYTMRWSPLLISPTILSLRFDYSEYVAGSAHPDRKSVV